MNPRLQRARAMMEAEEYAYQFDNDKFMVRSQTDPAKHYEVTNTDDGLACECPDRRFRKADCKHTKIVSDILKKNKCYKTNRFRITDRSKTKICKYCSSGNITKREIRKNKKGDVRRYHCEDCKRRFSANIGFERMKYDDSVITRSLSMYFRGMSYRDIADTLEEEGIRISHVTVYNWVCKYSAMLFDYLREIVPRVGDWCRADEVWVKIAGKQNYLFASMDDDTRFWEAFDLAETKFQHSADKLLEMTMQQIGKTPKVFKTDGLPAYARSSKRVFGKKTLHVRHIHLAGKRDRTTTTRWRGSTARSGTGRRCSGG